MSIWKILGDVSVMINAVAIILSTAWRLSTKVRTFKFKKEVLNSDMARPNTEEKRTSDVKKLVIGITTMILALGGLALHIFGPEKDVALSTGAAASIAVSLILAGSAIVVLRS